MPRLIEQLEVCVVAALRFARVSDFDHQIDVRSIIVTAGIRERIARILDAGKRALIQMDGRGFNQTRRHRFPEAHQFAVVSRRVGIGDVFRNMPQPLRLSLHSRGGETEGGGKIAHPRPLARPAKAGAHDVRGVAIDRQSHLMVLADRRGFHHFLFQRNGVAIRRTRAFGPAQHRL